MYYVTAAKLDICICTFMMQVTSIGVLLLSVIALPLLQDRIEAEKQNQIIGSRLAAPGVDPAVTVGGIVDYEADGILDD